MIATVRRTLAVPFGVVAIGTAVLAKILWEIALFVGGDSLGGESA